jgi:hypothetical protein
MHTIYMPNATKNESVDTEHEHEPEHEPVDMETEYEKTLESDKHPMSQEMYNMLTSVQGFIEMNGTTYEGYVTRWRVRHGNSLPDALT